MNGRRTPSYKFNLVLPPLLKDNLDISSIPPEDLRKEIGRVSWSETSDVRLSDDVLNWLYTETVYTVTRFYRWVPDDVPSHYAEDTTVKISKSKGYKKGQKEEIEKTLNLDVSGKIPLAGLKLDLKAGLKITEQTSEEWTESNEREVDVKFRADTTYVGWRLFDSVVAHKRVTKTWSCCDPRRKLGESEVRESESNLDVLMKFYQDKIRDSDVHSFWIIANGVAQHRGTQR